MLRNGDLQSMWEVARETHLTFNMVRPRGCLWLPVYCLCVRMLSRTVLRGACNKGRCVCVLSRLCCWGC